MPILLNFKMLIRWGKGFKNLNKLSLLWIIMWKTYVQNILATLWIKMKIV